MSENSGTIYLSLFRAVEASPSPLLVARLAKNGIGYSRGKAQKRNIWQKKGSSAGNGLTDFKQVCVMKVVKNFLPPVGEGEDEETIAPHE